LFLRHFLTFKKKDCVHSPPASPQQAEEDTKNNTHTHTHTHLHHNQLLFHIMHLPSTYLHRSFECGSGCNCLDCLKMLALAEPDQSLTDVSNDPHFDRMLDVIGRFIWRFFGNSFPTIHNNNVFPLHDELLQNPHTRRVYHDMTELHLFSNNGLFPVYTRFISHETTNQLHIYEQRSNIPQLQPVTWITPNAALWHVIASHTVDFDFSLHTIPELHIHLLHRDRTAIFHPNSFTNYAETDSDSDSEPDYELPLLIAPTTLPAFTNTNNINID
jgi:hypothetical protein